VSACGAAVQVRPDAKLAGELEAAETARLEAARNAMSPEELEAAVRETEELRRRQARRGLVLAPDLAPDRKFLLHVQVCNSQVCLVPHTTGIRQNNQEEQMFTSSFHIVCYTIRRHSRQSASNTKVFFRS
jgi:Zn-dependent M16 (insulinase) family peptidase